MTVSILRIIATLALCVFLTESQTSSSPPSACLEPPIVSHANYNRSGLADGALATYSCIAGYEATGSIHRTCRDGTWESSGAELYCSVITCNSPPSVSMGSYRIYYGSGYAVGSIVTYTCYSGYNISEPSEITCLANQSWSQPLPVCTKKDCGIPPLGDGLNVSYTTTDYYSRAEYTCQVGYDLYSNGYRQRSPSYFARCLSTGLWGTIPTCQPKNCGYPSQIRNGEVFSSGLHQYMDVTVYECNHGYQLVGNRTSSCLAEGSWSTAPTCKKVECSAPPVVNNATFNFNGKAYFGNSTVYTCAKGFEISGAPLISCQGDGTWTQAPVCSLVDCRSPPAIHFGTHTWTSTTFNSAAEYVCDEGYKLIGVSKIYCGAYGTWSEVPACEIPPDQTSGSSGRFAGHGSSSKSALTSLAIACTIFGVITLFCLIALVYKFFLAGRTSKLFSYASYKNGDDVINSSI
ncbi:sushi, von Willebrand factor type A, EGF and pentraxin domain-containing protein 1-like [Watersipora subatra]|uniref:sushi, von Willebrand factor type A, EGF and pentraxin domain-containing protein 1-like n=1 Tax=Watersipora subatra TaxID=2589382 RepID=UPI00355BDFD5